MPELLSIAKQRNLHVEQDVMNDRPRVVALVFAGKGRGT